MAWKTLRSVVVTFPLAGHQIDSLASEANALLRFSGRGINVSNTNAESALEIQGEGPAHSFMDVVWNGALNERRFALIDKQIQGTLTPTERGELARLTRMMRNQIDSEINVPLKGARELHRMLLQLNPIEEFD